MRKWASDLLLLVGDVLWALIEPLIHQAPAVRRDHYGQAERSVVALSGHDWSRSDARHRCS
jgi:hypothetical protein